MDTIFAPAFRIRAGKGKTPFGLERLHSASNLLFFNRALPTALVPNRDIGIQVLGDISGGVVSYLAGVMNGVPDGGSADLDTNDGKDVSGRFIVRPFNRHRDEPAQRSWAGDIGIDRAPDRRRRAPRIQDAVARAAVFLVQRRRRPMVCARRYSPQAFYYYKAFGGFAEYVHTKMPIRKGLVREEIAHDAWQVAGSFVLTGEAATDAGAGVRPRANFDFGNGTCGAFQVAARYHALKIDDRAFTLDLATAGSSRKAEAWTVGLNWYLTPNFKYMFNFERTVFDDDPDGPRKAENAFVFRTQVNF